MIAHERPLIEARDVIHVDQIDDLTLSQAAELLGTFDEFLGRLIRRFYEMGIDDSQDMEIAVSSLLGSQLNDCGHHRSFRIQDLVIRLRTRLYEDGDALASIRCMGGR